MFYKIILWLLLLTANVVLAQEADSVTYDHIHFKNTNRWKRWNKGNWKEVVSRRKAQLIYSPTYLLLKSSQGLDTIFLSSINETTREDFSGKTINIMYNNKSDIINIFFHDKRNAKIGKRFMQENGGHFRKQTIVKISTLIISAAGLVLIVGWW